MEAGDGGVGVQHLPCVATLPAKRFQFVHLIFQGPYVSCNNCRDAGIPLPTFQKQSYSNTENNIYSKQERDISIIQVWMESCSLLTLFSYFLRARRHIGK